MVTKVEDIKAVLQAYSVQPFYIEKKTDHLYWVQDHQQQYALKQSHLTLELIPMWEKVYREAYEQNLYAVLPVYLTRQGNIFRYYKGSIYYLTPWRGEAVTTFDKLTAERFFHNIGRVHAKTKQTHSVVTEDFSTTFQQYRDHCEQQKQQLLGFVEQYEKNRYMSPFELLICTQYRDIDFCLQESIRRIDQLIYEQETEKNWNYSLCHGNIYASHILKNKEQLYFINWEKARFDYPVYDLADFFKHETNRYDTPTDTFLQAFEYYMNENKLSKKELYLLIIQLLDAQPYLNQLEIHARSKKTMIEQIVELQYEFRRILFGLHFSAYVENKYETLDLDDLDDEED